MPQPRPPPKLEVFNDNAPAAMANSTFSSGGFVPSGTTTVQYLILEEGFEATYGTATEAGDNLTLALTQDAHDVVAGGTYNNDGSWTYSGKTYRLAVAGPGSSAQLYAIEV